MGEDEQLLQALDAIESELGGPAKLAALSGPDLCATYRKLKPRIEAALKVLDILAPRIATLVRFLMTLADKVCPV